MIKVDNEADQVLIAKVYKAGQDHVFRFWHELDESERRQLLDQLDGIDLQELAQLNRLRTESLEKPDEAAPLSEGLRPVEVIDRPADEAARARHEAARQRGEALIAEGRVAAFTVAGGQGTRLGWDAPKGTFPIGPVTERSLFQVFAEQLLAWSKRARRDIPWVIMTSEANHEDTLAFFDAQGWFGLPKRSVRFVTQRQLPAVDARGRMILASKARVATSPDGHGGALTALHRSGELERLSEAGVAMLFYFQVDNPLCPVLDPVFLGFHALECAEASTKVVSKEDPWEKVGVLGYRGETLCVIEYSELDEETRSARDESGRLRFRAGNIANHVFSVPFLRRLVEDGAALPYHLAHKAVPTIDAEGAPVEPEAPNGYKFERFIFDTLSAADGHVTLEVDRAEEFEPVKNAEGGNSPASARAALVARAGRWLEEAGCEVPRDATGAPTRACEIRPTTALDARELAARVAAGDVTLPAGDSAFTI